MINFRFHVVSIIAVFLALGIGVIMGTAVIDRAVVDRLERQQSGLRADITDVRSENGRLRSELRQERDAARQLADQGGERLLNGALTKVPVLLIGARGAEADGLKDFVTLLGRADADYQGTLWLTDRFTLDDADERSDLATALGLRPDASAATLRTAALSRLAFALRPAIDHPAGTDGAPPDLSTSPASDSEAGVVPVLRDAGFVDYEAPDGADPQSLPTLAAGTRIVVISGPGASVPNGRLTLPLVRNLLAPRTDAGPVPVLAATGAPPDPGTDDTFLGPIRDGEEFTGRLSTVDDLDDFAGRVAAVLAIADLGTGRTGDFGRGEGAQRLLPAPAE